MKMFIDRAGAYMDGFSVHLYDGINVTGTDTKRSGSNSEAVLDMVEAYSYIKLDMSSLLPFPSLEVLTTASPTTAMMT